MENQTEKLEEKKKRGRPRKVTERKIVPNTSAKIIKKEVNK